MSKSLGLQVPVHNLYACAGGTTCSTLAGPVRPTPRCCTGCMREDARWENGMETKERNEAELQGTSGETSRRAGGDGSDVRAGKDVNGERERFSLSNTVPRNMRVCVCRSALDADRAWVDLQYINRDDLCVCVREAKEELSARVTYVAPEQKKSELRHVVRPTSGDTARTPLPLCRAEALPLPRSARATRTRLRPGRQIPSPRPEAKGDDRASKTPRARALRPTQSCVPPYSPSSSSSRPSPARPRRRRPCRACASASAVPVRPRRRA